MKMKKKRFLGILLSLALMIGMMVGMSLTVYAQYNNNVNPIPGNQTDAGNGKVYFVGFTVDNHSEIISYVSKDQRYLFDGTGIESLVSYSTEKSPYSIEFHYNTPISPDKYYIASNDDTSIGHRMPKKWTIQAKLNERDNWTTIADVSSSTQAGENNVIYSFDFDSSKISGSAFKYFKFSVFETWNLTNGYNGYNNENPMLQIGEIYMSGQNMINNVEVKDIDAPEPAKNLDTSVTTSTDKVTLSDVTWIPAAPKNGKAAYATAYQATVTATAAQNYAFTDNTTATINGQKASVTKNQNGRLSISYTFPKTALAPATINATDKAVTYSSDGIAIPVEGMFAIPTSAGAATYSVTNGTGEGSFANNKLKVTKCGIFTVKVSTSETATHAAGNARATLTVNRVNAVAAKVTANNRTYAGTEKPLVTVKGKADEGTMQYALGKDATTAPTTGWSTSIPKGTNAGTYYVWYKVKGDANHTETTPTCITVKIAEDNTNNNNNPNNNPNNNGNGNTERITISTKPAAVKAKVKKKKNVTVSWKKIKKTKKTKALRKKIKSIQVQRADNKSFTQNVHSKKVGKTKTKVTFKLQRKKTYYVRVRYVGKGGYSKWSKVRRVKTK